MPSSEGNSEKKDKSAAKDKSSKQNNGSSSNNHDSASTIGGGFLSMFGRAKQLESPNAGRIGELPSKQKKKIQKKAKQKQTEMVEIVQQGGEARKVPSTKPKDVKDKPSNVTKKKGNAISASAQTQLSPMSPSGDMFTWARFDGVKPQPLADDSDNNNNSNNDTKKQAKHKKSSKKVKDDDGKKPHHHKSKKSSNVNKQQQQQQQIKSPQRKVSSPTPPSISAAVSYSHLSPNRRMAVSNAMKPQRLSSQHSVSQMSTVSGPSTASLSFMSPAIPAIQFDPTSKWKDAPVLPQSPTGLADDATENQAQSQQRSRGSTAQPMTPQTSSSSLSSLPAQNEKADSQSPKRRPQTVNPHNTIISTSTRRPRATARNADVQSRVAAAKLRRQASRGNSTTSRQSMSNAASGNDSQDSMSESGGDDQIYASNQRRGSNESMSSDIVSPKTPSSRSRVRMEIKSNSPFDSSDTIDSTRPLDLEDSRTMADLPKSVHSIDSTDTADTSIQMSDTPNSTSLDWHPIVPTSMSTSIPIAPIDEDHTYRQPLPDIPPPVDARATETADEGFSKHGINSNNQMGMSMHSADCSIALSEYDDSAPFQPVEELEWKPIVSTSLENFMSRDTEVKHTEDIVDDANIVVSKERHQHIAKLDTAYLDEAVMDTTLHSAEISVTFSDMQSVNDLPIVPEWQPPIVESHAHPSESKTMTYTGIPEDEESAYSVDESNLKEAAAAAAQPLNEEPSQSESDDDMYERASDTSETLELVETVEDWKPIAAAINPHMPSVTGSGQHDYEDQVYNQPKDASESGEKNNLQDLQPNTRSGEIDIESSSSDEGSQFDSAEMQNFADPSSDWQGIVPDATRNLVGIEGRASHYTDEDDESNDGDVLSQSGSKSSKPKHILQLRVHPEELPPDFSDSEDAKGDPSTISDMGDRWRSIVQTSHRVIGGQDDDDDDDDVDESRYRLPVNHDKAPSRSADVKMEADNDDNSVQSSSSQREASKESFSEPADNGWVPAVNLVSPSYEFQNSDGDDDNDHKRKVLVVRRPAHQSHVEGDGTSVDSVDVDSVLDESSHIEQSEDSHTVWLPAVQENRLHSNANLSTYAVDRIGEGTSRTPEQPSEDQAQSLSSEDDYSDSAADENDNNGNEVDDWRDIEMSRGLEVEDDTYNEASSERQAESKIESQDDDHAIHQAKSELDGRELVQGETYVDYDRKMESFVSVRDPLRETNERHDAYEQAIDMDDHAQRKKEESHASQPKIKHNDMLKTEVFQVNDKQESKPFVSVHDSLNKAQENNDSYESPITPSVSQQSKARDDDQSQPEKDQNDSTEHKIIFDGNDASKVNTFVSVHDSLDHTIKDSERTYKVEERRSIKEDKSVDNDNPIDAEVKHPQTSYSNRKEWHGVELESPRREKQRMYGEKIIEGSEHKYGSSDESDGRRGRPNLPLDAAHSDECASIEVTESLDRDAGTIDTATYSANLNDTQNVDVDDDAWAQSTMIRAIGADRNQSMNSSCDLSIKSMDRQRKIQPVKERRTSELKREVQSRRATLTHMFESTTKKSLDCESELLELKRKLALSQALVQNLEVENTFLQRRALLDFGQAKLKLMEEVHEHESHMEYRLKKMQSERDESVQECHFFRKIILSSCPTCRKRLDKQEFVMDRSVRDTILSRQNVPGYAAFAWLRDGLAVETQSTNESLRPTEQEIHSLPPRYQQRRGSMWSEASIATTLPDSSSVVVENHTAFTDAPLRWLTDKLQVSSHSKKGHNSDIPTVIEGTILPSDYQAADANASTKDNMEEIIAGESCPNEEDLRESSAGLASDEASLIKNATMVPDPWLSHQEPTSQQTMPQTPRTQNSNTSGKTSIFGFLGSLISEQVQEDPTLFGSSSSHKDGAEKTSTGRNQVPKIFKFGFKAERVEDDGIDRLTTVGPDEVHRSLLPSEQIIRSRGLKEEQIEGDGLHDVVSSVLPEQAFAAVSADGGKPDVSRPQIPSTPQTFKAKSRVAKSPRPSFSPLEGQPGMLSPWRRNSSKLSRASVSGTSTTPTTGKVPRYLGKFKEKSSRHLMSPSQVTQKTEVKKAPTIELLPGATLMSPHQRAPSLDEDLIGSRPWRSDKTILRGSNPKSGLQAGKEDQPLSDEVSLGSREELGDLAALNKLMVDESSSWEA